MRGSKLTRRQWSRSGTESCMTEPARFNQDAAAIIARRANSETTSYEQARETTGKFYAACEPEIWPDIA